MKEPVVTVIRESIQSDPIAFAAALDAKIAGGSPEEQRQAALDAYRDQQGLPRIPVVETPVPLDEKEIIGTPIAEMPKPLPVGDAGKQTPLTPRVSTHVGPLPEGEGDGEGEAQAQAAEDDLMYRRFSLARVRNDARGVDFDALEETQVDDILALRGRRMDFAEWVSIRFPNA